LYVAVRPHGSPDAGGCPLTNSRRVSPYAGFLAQCAEAAAYILEYLSKKNDLRGLLDSAVIEQ